MPELAEVDYYRKRWDAGLGGRIVRVHLHADKRVFRGADAKAMAAQLAGQRLVSSESAGKQMVFRFSGHLWLGIHLGMTGKLSTVPPDYVPQKHDHLVLFQQKRALIFSDMRQFGRVRFAESAEAPSWWSDLPPDPTSERFTLEVVDRFIARHGKLCIKPALLLQDGFPGIGNWMADEILWRAAIAPKRKSSVLKKDERRALWRETRYVSRHAMKNIGETFGDPPKSWLFHQRWSRNGVCPRHKTALRRETIGGRTTAWCPKCQR